MYTIEIHVHQLKCHWKNPVIDFTIILKDSQLPQVHL